MTTPYTCPLCCSPIDLDDQAETVNQIYRVNPGGVPYVELVVRKAVVEFCTGCEFAIEVIQ